MRRPPFFRYPTKCLNYNDTAELRPRCAQKVLPNQRFEPSPPASKSPTLRQQPPRTCWFTTCECPNTLHPGHYVTKRRADHPSPDLRRHRHFLPRLRCSLRLAFPTHPPRIFRAPNNTLVWVNDLEQFARFAKLLLNFQLPSGERHAFVAQSPDFFFQFFAIVFPSRDRAHKIAPEILQTHSLTSSFSIIGRRKRRLAN